MASPIKTDTLLDGVIGTGAGTAKEPLGLKRTFQLTGFTSAGAGACSVNVEVSNDGTNFITLGNVGLTLGTSVTSDGFTSDAPWRYVRGNVVSISGTDGECTLTIGNEGA